MRKPYIGIAPEGYPFIFLCAFSSLIFAIIGCWLMAVLFLFATWCSGHFFRDPERVIPTAPDLVTSPADGRVIKIEMRPDPFSGELRSCLSIFMNVCNVHVNRSPIAGMVSAIAYYPGAFVNADRDKASTENERCAYALDGDSGSVSMVQIAGLIARRIVCRVEEGDTLRRGERFGLIRFGSRVDLYIGGDYEWRVCVGEKVVAGESVLASRKNA